MAVDKDRIVCQVFDVAVDMESVANAAILSGTYVAAVSKSSIIHRNHMISKSS